MNECIRWIAGILLCLIMGGWVGSTHADEAERDLAWMVGPASVPLADQAVLTLPEGYRAIGSDDTQYVLEKMGNFPSGTELALIAPSADSPDSWFVVVRYVDAGYIRDDEAKDWDADGLLTSVEEGTDEDNRQRKDAGQPALLIRGWEQKPAYDKASNKVVWAISHTVEGEEGVGVNYNTLALGRHGYMSMNMVGDLNELAAMKPKAELLLTAMSFVDGKRYADFNSATDKVAAVGLTALVAGVAAKTGLLAKLWAFLLPVVLVAKKFIVLLVVAIIALARSLLKRMRANAGPPTASPAP